MEQHIQRYTRYIQDDLYNIDKTQILGKSETLKKMWETFIADN